ncbi:carboxylate-amine ligase [Ktedonosporobacter rubrisoli]|uniref:Putative glutamate--cysteine ligase 2 n=1 Tax=Ktedonosporobacter rubrisoli TaxID=2509675 RepID=A0A4P6JW85_KTERU|nr:carboxylate-amine ligase [Ktedonosporobacter rubrisoli]QBD79824.1 carboxylate-amine ligase [Ktedonosporobacter rubrisoli]
MKQRFTLGIEEEFQMVDRHTGQLASHIHTILEKGATSLGEHIKAEMLQSVVELVTDVCPNIAAARNALQRLRGDLTQLVEDEGLALISAGTHPLARWQDQMRTRNERYTELEEEYQDVGRSILIFGLHVHVGIDDHEISVPLMNQLRTWIPHLLALSSNSPFWAGRYSGMKSYRAIVWKRFPRNGIPEVFAGTHDFEHYVQTLMHTGCIDNGKRIWWDIRPHPFFNTIEFRICDMPPTIEDSLALAALCQALVAKLTWLYRRNLATHVLPAYYIEENKWRASRHGLDAEIVDFAQSRRLGMRDAIGELLDFVDDVLDDLGSRREINYLRALLEDPRGTGADRQISVYQETGSVQAVTRFLMQQTVEGLSRYRVA